MSTDATRTVHCTQLAIVKHSDLSTNGEQWTHIVW